MARFPSATNVGNNLHNSSPDNAGFIAYIQHPPPRLFNEFEKGYFLTEKKGASFAGY
ncbi:MULTISPECIES: hypothetical protein [Pseudomonas syringae group]|uniref:hypothetical protein n=1 Tax=Pseudomonas syringae group TaxID=136849 RepID=UPI000A8362EC|nr:MULTISPECIES: hypothetical protein [Pseudomonas syringae group]